MDINLAFVMAILDLLTKYGIPGVIKIIKLWNVEDPTLEDIQGLKLLMKPPELYFKKDQDDSSNT